LIVRHVYLVLYLIVVYGQFCTDGGRVVLEVEVELVLVELLVEDVLVLELVEDTEVEVDWLVEVEELVLEVEVVVVKKAAAISSQSDDVVQLKGAVSLVVELALYSTALTPLEIMRL
jgi:hypothetical protein